MNLPEHRGTQKSGLLVMLVSPIFLFRHRYNDHKTVAEALLFLLTFFYKTKFFNDCG